MAPRNSSAVPVLTSNQAAALSNYAGSDNSKHSSVATIRVVRQTEMTPQTQTCIPVTSSTPGMFSVEPASLWTNFPMLHVAPGIINFSEINAVLVLVSNLSRHLSRLPKNMIVAHGSLPPQNIVNIHDDADKIGIKLEGTDSTVAVVHRKQVETGETQMKRRGEIQSSESMHKSSYWQQQVNFSKNYFWYRQDFLQMMDPFAKMWHGHLGRSSVANQFIDLALEVTTV